jgi:hypothetical protein
LWSPWSSSLVTAVAMVVVVVMAWPVIVVVVRQRWIPSLRGPTAADPASSWTGGIGSGLPAHAQEPPPARSAYLCRRSGRCPLPPARSRRGRGWEGER